MLVWVSSQGLVARPQGLGNMRFRQCHSCQLLAAGFQPASSQQLRANSCDIAGILAYFLIPNPQGLATKNKNKKISSQQGTRYSCYHPISQRNHFLCLIRYAGSSLDTSISITGAPGPPHHSTDQTQRPSSISSSVLPLTTWKLSLTDSFMYSSLHCLYEVEHNIHFHGGEVKTVFVKKCVMRGAQCVMVVAAHNL